MSYPTVFSFEETESTTVDYVKRVKRWYHNIDWELVFENLLKTTVGYSAVSVAGLIPIFIALFLIRLLPAIGAEENIWAEAALLLLVIITIGYFLGLVFGLVIRNFQYVRGALKIIWIKHTPPYPENIETDIRDVETGDRKTFNEAERKLREFAFFGVTTLLVEILFLALGVALLVLIGVNDISTVVDSVASLLNTAEREVSGLSILGAIVEVLHFVVQINSDIIALALPTSIFFTFATQNGAYMFGEIFILRENRVTLKQRRFTIYLLWSIVSFVLFLLFTLLLAASALSTPQFSVFAVVFLASISTLVYYVLKQ